MQFKTPSEVGSEIRGELKSNDTDLGAPFLKENWFKLVGLLFALWLCVGTTMVAYYLFHINKNIIMIDGDIVNPYTGGIDGTLDTNLNVIHQDLSSIDQDLGRIYNHLPD